MVLLVCLVSQETLGYRVFLDKMAPQDRQGSQGATGPRVIEEVTGFPVYMACRALLASLDS